jgi:hypothetical protein
LVFIVTSNQKKPPKYFATRHAFEFIDINQFLFVPLFLSEASGGTGLDLFLIRMLLKTLLYLTCEKKNNFLEYIELHFF